MEDFFKANKAPKTSKQKDMNFIQGYDSVNLNPVGDKDKDGVPNWDDCKPFDSTKDGWLLDKLRRRQEAPPEESAPPSSNVEYRDLKQMDEHMRKEKTPVKKTLLQKLKDNRDEARKEKEHYRHIYRDEYGLAKAKAIKKRARQEAFEKHRPTRKQKIDNALAGFADLGFGAAGVKPPKHGKSSSKKKGKPNYAIIGGKAYPIAGSEHNKSQHQKTKKKRNDFDFDWADDIGNFDF